jgi:tRNA-Thr(GGU) m(6)t(6)A37 methyltransferase TsaA
LGLQTLDHPAMKHRPPVRLAEAGSSRRPWAACGGPGRRIKRIASMGEESGVRPGELSVELPRSFDAGMYFIGRIRTPFKRREDCPRNIAASDATGRVELDTRYAAGLDDLKLYSHAILLYWMNEARRDLIRQVPGHLGRPRGTFALRSPVRPNPIALAAVKILGIEGTALTVATVDCLDGTPLLDIKPYYPSIDSVSGATVP